MKKKFCSADAFVACKRKGKRGCVFLFPFLICIGAALHDVGVEKRERESQYIFFPFLFLLNVEEPILNAVALTADSSRTVYNFFFFSLLSPLPIESYHKIPYLIDCVLASIYPYARIFFSSISLMQGLSYLILCLFRFFLFCVLLRLCQSAKSISSKRYLSIYKCSYLYTRNYRYTRTRIPLYP